MPSRSVLEDAHRLVNGPRAAAYGHYPDHAKKLAILWSLLLGFDVPVEKVPLMMMGLKMLRLAHDPFHRDSLNDNAGFAELMGRVIDTIEEELKDSEPLPIEELEKVFSVRAADSG